MNTLPQDDLDLREGVATLALMNEYSPVVQAIAQNIYNNGFDTESRDLILRQHDIVDVVYIKERALNFIIDYIKMVLNDYIVSEKERENVTLLKYYFKIKEGDFYKYKYREITEILYWQFEKIYEDKIVTKEEAVHKVEVQGLFSLSLDQFLEIKKKLKFE